MSTLTNCPFCNARIEPGTSRCPVCRNGLPTAAPTPRHASPTTSLTAGTPHAFNARIDEEDQIDTAHEIRTPPPVPAVGVLMGGRHRLTERLGAGVLGTSWAARDMVSGLDVVVKIISEDLLLDDDARLSFVQGIEMFTSRTLAGCVMPQEVAVHGAYAYVVTPRVNAVSLRRVIEARRAKREPFTPEEALRVLLSLVGATQALHSATPHGSLRPENVLLSRKGLFLTDCVTGVCVAPDRVVHAAGDWPAAMPYIAPEVLRGRRPTATADLFAIGAIAVELLGGAAPGRGGDVAAVSVDLHKATAVLLDADPRKRPAGVRMLLDTLSSVAGFATRPVEPPLPVPENTGLHDEPASPPPMASVAPSAALVASPPDAPPPTDTWNEQTDEKFSRRRMPSDPSIPVETGDLDGATVVRKAPESPRGDAVTVARPAPTAPAAATIPPPAAASSAPPPGHRLPAKEENLEERTTVGPAPKRKTVVDDEVDPEMGRATRPSVTAAKPVLAISPVAPIAPAVQTTTEPQLGSPPGRLSSATASLPRYGTAAPAGTSGPPPSMSIKSGPPPGASYASGPPAAITVPPPAKTPDPERPVLPPSRSMPSILANAAGKSPNPTSRMQPVSRSAPPTAIAPSSPPPAITPPTPSAPSPAPVSRRPGVPAMPPGTVRPPPPSVSPAASPASRVPGPPPSRSAPPMPSPSPRASVAPPVSARPSAAPLAGPPSGPSPAPGARPGPPSRAPVPAAAPSKPPRPRRPTQSDGIDPRLLRAAQVLDAERTGQVLTSDDLEEDD